ncbi:hypothetical protein ACFVTT_35465 [Streptomyces niveus]|uniref:hypothetical protein n=1 Tax=Streptomyces niveus TaxID=193462 RepID=UPI003432CD1A
MKTDFTPQVREQGGPILLLARLHQTLPDLPAAKFDLSHIYPDRLSISVYDDLAAFEAWRTALGFGAPTDKHHGGSSWLVVEGLVDDVPVRLTGFGATADVKALAAALVTA